MTESCACAMEQMGMKPPGIILSYTGHLLNDRKLRLRNVEVHQSFRANLAWLSQ
jgi:hypothetical protein